MRQRGTPIPARSTPVSDAYAAAGVDTGEAHDGVGALVSVLSTIDPGRPSRSVLAPGHYASVLAVTADLGIAVSTDGVGSKLVVAEQAGRLETIGIDCVAMNVNDIVCVGAEPVALLDYLAVERVDPAALAAIAAGLKRGAEDAGVEIPGGELAVLPDLIRGHPSPHGFDLCATAIGTVALDAIITGERCAPGDALIGLPASGLHSNGYTLARRVLQERAGLALSDRPPELDGASLSDVLLEPTVIYVRAMLDLLASDVPVHGLSHITGDGVLNLLRLAGEVGYAIDAPLPVPAICRLVCELGGLEPAEAYEVFNMGCGFVCVVAPERAAEAVELLTVRHPGAAVVGEATARTGQVELPSLAVAGDHRGLRAA
jgi:phosphoribosylformylglycinamidine cyclo-ligase